jgi:hypothetical protein
MKDIFAPDGKNNFWYASRPNEIFLDLDSNRSTARALSVLRLAVRKKHLAVKQVWLYGTPTTHHAHMIVVLKDPMHWLTKIAWSLWLGNDRLRAAYVLERSRYVKWTLADLLVTKTPYYREWDQICRCTKKHKTEEVTSKCPAMRLLLGNQRSADYFTRTGKAPPRRKIRVPWGRVSLKQIKNWSDR